MPFGVANGPAYFQGFINQILHDLVNNGLVAFFNDILIYSETLPEL